MKHKIVVSLLFVLLVSAAMIVVKYSMNDPELKINPEQEKPLKLFLYEQILNKGLNHYDYLTLREVIKCESSWQQVDQNGETIVSSGNIGLGQINQLAHEKEYQALSLNMNNAYDNLMYVVLLYEREGLTPWRNWSGHCWENKIPTYPKRSRK